MSEKPGGVPDPADFFGWLNQMVNFPASLAAAIASPTSTSTPDPLTFWKELGENNEEAWVKLIGTPEFAKAFGQSATNTARYRLMIKQAARKYLEAAELAGREDLALLGEQLVNLDARVDDLTDELRENNDQILKTLERLVATMETINHRLDRLEEQLNRLEAKPAQPEVTPAKPTRGKTRKQQINS